MILIFKQYMRRRKMVDPIVCTGVCLVCTAMAYYVGKGVGGKPMRFLFYKLQEEGSFQITEDTEIIIRKS